MRMRYSYRYSELVDYLEDIKEKRIKVKELLDKCLEAESGNYSEHNKGVVFIANALIEAKVATTTYERGCINIKAVVEEIRRICA